MVNPMIIILIIGIISAVFGALLIFVPEAILKAERQANRLFMTDAVFLKNRIPIGIGLLGVSAFLGYTYAGEPLNEIIFLVTAILSGVFGLLLLVSPNTILQAERHANKLYMTDAFFLKNRIPIGIGLLGVSAFLGYTYAGEPLNKIIFLVTALLSGIFGMLLLVSPNTILQAERHANKLYMTDAFFLKNRIPIGIGLIAASAFMVYTYISFS